MMRHQYWVTKKTVLKKLGTKEDECIVASDAELDAKLELFRSISDSCLQFQRVLDQYNERLCLLAHEESTLGRFLRESGKNADAAGTHMVKAGKAISYSGQLRVSMERPIMRLYQEVETFRGRAVSDMRSTVSAMEKARIEYRAALSWMKSASSELDPDTGRGLDNFRKAQQQVRESKKLFDKLSLDVLQKIDLLAAARCNMFSHVLINYQNSFLNFASKIFQTLTSTADSMNTAPQYEFCVLKELSPNLGDGNGEEKKEEILAQDKDQMLFFQDEYKDDKPDNSQKPDSTESSQNNEKPSSSENNDKSEPTSSVNLIDTSLLEPEGSADCAGISSDLAGLRLDCGDVPANFGSFLPSQLLQGLNVTDLLDETLAATPEATSSPKSPKPESKPAVGIHKKEDKAAWFKLFAELDPLANPDNIPGTTSNQSHAA